jgi:hypothetical protein
VIIIYEGTFNSEFNDGILMNCGVVINQIFES